MSPTSSDIKKVTSGIPTVIDNGDSILVVSGAGGKAAMDSGVSNPRESLAQNQFFSNGEDPKFAQTKPREDGEWVKWGIDDCFPYHLRQIVARNTVAPRCLRFKVQAHYGLGHIYGHREVQGDHLKFTPADDKQLNAFLRRIRISRFATEQITSYEWFARCHSEFILDNTPNPARRKVVDLQHVDAPKLRFKPAKGNEPRKAIIHHDFSRYNKKEAVELQVVGPWMSAEEVRELIIAKNLRRFIYYDYFPMPGMDYYPFAYWYGVLNGWLQVANEIPLLKSALMRNQAIVKYHIKIPMSYWDKRWSQLGLTEEAAQQAQAAKEIEDLKTFLKDRNNIGGSFHSGYDDTMDYGSKSQGWIIEPLKNEMLGNGDFLMDSAAVNSEIAFAAGVDPTLFGHGVPGAKLSSGSGSDKRVAFNILTALLASDRERTTSSLRLVEELNGWELHDHSYRNLQLHTLDQNPTGTSTSV